MRRSCRRTQTILYESVSVIVMKSVPLGIPPTHRLRKNSGNPTHGSGWMVQVRPTNRDARPPDLFFSPSLPSLREGREGKRKILGVPLCRQGLNHPPTAVGGIREAVDWPSSVGWP